MDHSTVEALLEKGREALEAEGQIRLPMGEDIKVSQTNNERKDK